MKKKLDEHKIAKMFTQISDVSFTEEGILFRNYPFAPASVFPSKIVEYQEITEVSFLASPPEIRCFSGEVLFIPANQRAELKAIAEKYDLFVFERVDIWGLILEPFLDTQLNQDHEERTIELLRANGVDLELSEQLREEVFEAMGMYNFISGLWDWVHLGLYDLLSAESGLLQEEEFAIFYWRAMEIAALGKGRQNGVGCLTSP